MNKRNMKGKMKDIKKLSGYISPMLNTMEIELERVIATSCEISMERDATVTETWIDEELTTGEIEIFK